jgi:hypothetical protein
MRANLLLGLTVLLVGTFIGCSPAYQPRDPDATTGEPTLTPEAAKQALLARMKADQLFGFDADRWSQEVVGEARDGWREFGGNFRINLASRKYTVRYGPPPEIRGCTFTFEGSFSLRDGVWVADDPVELKSALGGGK